MTIDACVAHAIHSDLDIIKELPGLCDIPPEDMEPVIDRFILGIQQAFVKPVESNLTLVQRKDAQGLAAAIKRDGIRLSDETIAAMAKTIVDFSEINARFIMDARGCSVYEMRITIAIPSSPSR